MKDIDNDSASDLPEGWEYAKLEEISFKQVSLKPAKIFDKGFYYVDIEAVDNNSYRINNPRYLKIDEAPSRARMYVEPGNIIFSLVRPYLKNIAIAGKDCINHIASTAFHVIKIKPPIESKYIHYQLIRDEFISNIPTYGNSPPSARDDEFTQLLLYFAPIEEQKRIVAKIDEIFEQVTKVKESLEKSKNLVKQFRKAVLTKAFKGELVPTEAELARRDGRDYETASALLEKIKSQTKEISEKPNTKTTTPFTDNEPPTDLPEGWIMTSIQELFEFKYGKGLVESKRCKGMFKVYGSNGVVGSHNETITNKPCIIIGRKGSIGEIHYNNDSCWPIDTTYYIDEFRQNEPMFVYYCLKNLNLKEDDTSSAIPGLSRNIAYKKEIILPPIIEQKRIVKKIDELYAFADEIEAHIDIALKRTDTIKQAVLAKAFRGELVITEAELARREGRDYESASALLERIKNQIGNSTEKQKKKRTGKKDE